MKDLIVPEVVERMYLDLARARKPQPALVPAEAKNVQVTKADVDAILRRTRGASAEELKQIISREKEFILTNTQRDPGKVPDRNAAPESREAQPVYLACSSQFFKPLAHILTPATAARVTHFTVWAVYSQQGQQMTDPTSQRSPSL